MGGSSSKFNPFSSIPSSSHRKNSLRNHQESIYSRMTRCFSKKMKVEGEFKSKTRLELQSELDDLIINYKKYPPKAFELLEEIMKDYFTYDSSESDGSKCDMKLEIYLSTLLEKSVESKNIPFSKYIISKYIIKCSLCKQKNLMNVIRYAFQTGDTHFIRLMIQVGGDLSKKIPKSNTIVIEQALNELILGQGKVSIVDFLFKNIREGQLIVDELRKYFEMNYSSTKPDEFRITPTDWQAIKWDEENIQSEEFLDIKKDIQSGKKIYYIQDNESITKYNCRFYSSVGILRCQYFISFTILALAESSMPKRSLIRKVRDTLIFKSIEEATEKSKEDTPKFRLPSPVKSGVRASSFTNIEIESQFTPVANYKSNAEEKNLKEILTKKSSLGWRIRVQN